MRYAILGALLLAAAAGAGNEPGQWVFFDSVETGAGPRLECELADGTRRTLPATEDTVLISYLAERPWPALPQLSVSLGDTNRVLLRFGDLPAGVKRAELVLSLKMSRMPPAEPFDLSLYRVAGPWEGRTATWKEQPPADPQPCATFRVPAEEAELRWDVTQAVNAGAPFGFLLKVAGPLLTLDQVLAGAATWERDADAARERARKEKRLVLAFVTGEAAPQDSPTLQEQLLTALVLAEPAVQELVRERFVLLRTGFPGQMYTQGAPADDPLAPLGTRVADAKPPALVACTASGRHLATLESIGTYSPPLVLRFLAGALKAAHLPPPPRTDSSPGMRLLRAGRFEEAAAALAGEEGDEARYYLACLRARAGDHAAARALLEAVAADSPWHRKAAARLRAPERMAMFEALRDLEPEGAGTEAPAGTDAVARACAWLVGQQREDGTWTTANGADEYQAAVTALCARALFVHGEAPGAVERATAWLRDWVRDTDPERANAWSAGYTLDFFLERLRAEPRARDDAQRAAAFVARGQAPNGAWSYNRRWGVETHEIRGWPPMPDGRYHSMNTGPSLASLALARELGLEVRDEVLAKGKEALLSMREEPGVFTYTWPVPRNWNESPETSLGRAPACELALFRLGATKRRDLKTTAGYFLKYRAHLRRSVKVTAGWTMPGGASAYFYHFAYLHAADALRELKDERGLRALRKDLLAVAEADGTWVDWPMYGKPYATAAALLVLKE